MNDACMCFEGGWRLTGDFYKLAVRKKVTEKYVTLWYLIK